MYRGEMEYVKADFPSFLRTHVYCMLYVVYPHNGINEREYREDRLNRLNRQQEDGGKKDKEDDVSDFLIQLFVYSNLIVAESHLYCAFPTFVPLYSHHYTRTTTLISLYSYHQYESSCT